MGAASQTPVFAHGHSRAPPPANHAAALTALTCASKGIHVAAPAGMQLLMVRCLNSGRSLIRGALKHAIAAFRASSLVMPAVISSNALFPCGDRGAIRGTIAHLQTRPWQTRASHALQLATLVRQQAIDANALMRGALMHKPSMVADWNRLAFTMFARPDVFCARMPRKRWRPSAQVTLHLSRIQTPSFVAATIRAAIRAIARL